ncbi:MAG: right-handed parallel beta-helix repeat-containing protein [Fermentimonas sp.]
MISKSTIKKLMFLFLVILYSVELAQAGEQITLSPDGGHSNQEQISKALEKGDVHLSAGVYEIDGTIIISSNRVLSGDPNAIVRVWSGSSQWFTGATGVISCKEPVQNVEICGFQMDGNIGSLPKSYSDSRSDTDHDCEKLIILKGYSNQYANNIKVHDMKLYNSFSDGFYIIFGESVFFYNNIVSNCQHEGFYFSCVKKGAAYGNKIAGITSDCGRLDNCIDCKVYDNLFFSYTGESYGAWKGGQAGLQIANTGSSHGYDGSKKPQMTDRVEVTNNTFADPGRQAIWLHNYNGSVFVHDNKFKDAVGLETLGIPVGDISVDNPPTVEMSEKVFSSIFDILEVEFTDTGRTEQTAEDIPLQVVDTEQGKIAGGVKIVGFKDVITIENTSYIPDENAVLVKSRVIRNPNLIQWSGVIQDIKKNISVKIENGTAYAEMKVKTSWYTVKNDHMTGKKTKGKIRTSTATFQDSYSPVPEILHRETTAKAVINVFKDTKNPIAKVSISHTNATQRIEYTYGENTTTRQFMIGERITDETGLQYTAFSRCDIWEGTIPHMGNELIVIGTFEPEKLKIKYYTPYESFEVEDIEIIYHKNEGESPFMATLKFIVQMVLAMYAGYKIMEIAIN